jgi:hypothetical protein
VSSNVSYYKVVENVVNSKDHTILVVATAIAEDSSYITK